MLTAYPSLGYSGGWFTMVYTAIETIESFGELARRYSSVSAEFYGLLAEDKLSEELIPASTTKDAADLCDGVYFVKEGQLAYSISGMTLMLFEQGDLFVFDSAPLTDAAYLTDFATIVQKLPKADLDELFSKKVQAWHLYTQLVTYFSQLTTALARSVVREQVDFSPHVVTYQPGEVIVHEGDVGESVYTLVEGCAEVEAQGVPVGEIGDDEIFGALAAFGDTKRTATVTAKTNCTVLALPKESFVTLIQLRPQTISKMIVDLARKMNDLNAQVIELKNRG